MKYPPQSVLCPRWGSLAAWSPLAAGSSSCISIRAQPRALLRVVIHGKQNLISTGRIFGIRVSPMCPLVPFSGRTMNGCSEEGAVSSSSSLAALPEPRSFLGGEREVGEESSLQLMAVLCSLKSRLAASRAAWSSWSPSQCEELSLFSLHSVALR